MIILFLLISIGLIFLDFIIQGDGCLIVIGALLTTIFLIAGLFLLADLTRSSVAEERIAMYQEENELIETQIDELVNGYMEHERETFESLKSESAITLVSLYPELKADTLVQTQIATHTQNNNKIKELKEQLIMRSVTKWWLYFGK